MARKNGREQHLSALRSLSSMQPREPLERGVEAIRALGATEAAEFLDSLRMRTLVSRRLADVAETDPVVRECVSALSAKVERLRLMHEVLETNLRRVEDMALDLGVPVFGGKGIGAHTMYPDRSVRDFNDIDLFLRDRADAAKVATELRIVHGYRYQKYELPWFKADPRERVVYGQIALVAPPDRPDLLNVDIHFGDYSVRHCGRLGIADAFWADKPGFHVLAPEENLACIVNNAAGDYFVTAKDTNDLLMALSLPGFDTARFADLLHGSHLDGFFGFIAATLRGSTVLTAEQVSRLREIPVRQTLEPRPRPDTADWNRRCLGTTVHAFATRREYGVVSAVRVAADAFSYYRKRLKLTAAPAGARREAAKAIALNPWTCVRLVPVDLALELVAGRGGGGFGGGEGAAAPSVATLDLDPGIERYESPAGTYFRIDGEVFIGTVDYVLDEDVIRQAAGSAG